MFKQDKQDFIMLHGGTIDIGDGTFEVHEDGTVSINSGDVNIGPVVITDTYANLGAFRISSNEFGALVSTDNEHSIQIYSSANTEWKRGLIQVSDRSGNTTRISSEAVGVVEDIYISSMPREEGWSSDWDSVKKNIVELWRRIEDLEARL